MFTRWCNDELAKRGRKTVIVDQEAENNLGGQAFWSLGGLFMVDTPEQRRMGIRDSLDLARTDWMGSAQFDRPEDDNPRRVAEAYLDYAAGRMREDLAALGMRWFPIVGWAERGGSFADGHGNSVPRFHLTWGTGPGVLRPFEARVLQGEKDGKVTFGFRHKVTRLDVTDGRVTGVAGDVLAPDDAVRGAATNRDVVDSFDIACDHVIVTSGGIGGNFDLVRRNWRDDLYGPLPEKMVSGVPAHVDGLMLDVARQKGVYEALHQVDLNGPTKFEAGSVDCVITCGTTTQMPCASLREFARIVRATAKGFFAIVSRNRVGQVSTSCSF